MRYLKIILQVVVLCGISWLGNQIAACTSLAIPGNIFGLLILFILLEYKVLPVGWIEVGANLLISELLLFFIPSAIGIIRFQGLLLDQLSYLMAVIVFSTIAVLMAVGIITEAALWYRRKRRTYVRSV